MGTEPDPERTRIPAIFFGCVFGPDLNFRENRSRIRYYALVYIERKVHLRKSMAEMGTEPESGSESKIWRLTGFGAGFLVFGSGSSFGIYFSDSAYLCSTHQKLFLVTVR